MPEIPSFPVASHPDATPAELDRIRRQVLAELARVIPPSGRVDHEPLKVAIVTYEEARRAEHEARQAHVQLLQELPAAEYKDEVGLADAREHGKADPGPKNAERHRKAIAEAKRDWGASKVTLARAVEAVTEAFAEHGEEWSAELEVERAELRAEVGELLDGVEAVWRKLQRNAAARVVARGGHAQDPSVFTNSFRVPRVKDGSVVDVVDVLAALRDLARPDAAQRPLAVQAPIPVAD